MSLPEIGALAPAFSLAAGPGPDRVSLSDFAGRPVVVMFVPLAFSGTCTREFCHVRERWDVWGNLGATIVGISVDSPFVVKRWREEMGVPFEILSDFNKEAATSYGVLYEDFFGLQGVAKRSVFVVDADGHIAYSWVDEDSDVLPPFEEVREAVERL